MIVFTAENAMIRALSAQTMVRTGSSAFLILDWFGSAGALGAVFVIEIYVCVDGRKDAMTRVVPAPRITMVRAQLGQQAVDALVNGAPSIRKLAEGSNAFIWQWDRRQRKELDALIRSNGVPVGEAVAGSGGKLPARWVVHTVYPADIGSNEALELLGSCYREAMTVAAGLGARSVGFAKMLWPDPEYAEGRRRAAWVAVSSAMNAPPPLTEIVFASPDPDVASVYADVYESLSRS